MVSPKRLGTLDKKKAFEAQFTAWAADKPLYRDILNQLHTLYSQLEPYAFARDYYQEAYQAIEMTQIYRDIIKGTRELMSTVINNRLNNAMKYLAAITIVMSIPTIISGLWGMNVSGKWMPLSNTPFGFGILCMVTLAICIVAMIILKRRKML